MTSNGAASVGACLDSFGVSTFAGSNVCIQLKKSSPNTPVVETNINTMHTVGGYHNHHCSEKSNENQTFSVDVKVSVQKIHVNRFVNVHKVEDMTSSRTVGAVCTCSHFQCIVYAIVAT